MHAGAVFSRVGVFSRVFSTLRLFFPSFPPSFLSTLLLSFFRPLLSKKPWLGRGLGVGAVEVDLAGPPWW